MNLLDEVIADSKFERNTRIFKNFLYIVSILGASLLIYSIYSNKHSKREKDYNQKVTDMILANKVDLKELDQTIESKFSINKVAKFKFISSRLENRPDKKSVQNEIVPLLEELIKDNNRIIRESAVDYLTLLILDHPEYFDKEYSENHFKNNTNNKLFKAMWLKNNSKDFKEFLDELKSNDDPLIYLIESIYE